MKNIISSRLTVYSLKISSLIEFSVFQNIQRCKNRVCCKNYMWIQSYGYSQHWWSHCKIWRGISGGLRLRRPFREFEFEILYRWDLFNRWPIRNSGCGRWNLRMCWMGPTRTFRCFQFLYQRLLHPKFQQCWSLYRSQGILIFNFNRYRRGLETCPQAKTSKSGHAIFFSFFPTRPSDEYDSAPSRKYSRPLLDVFACIG